MQTPVNQTAESFKALADDIRIRLALLLLGREACVCELMEVFSMAQSKLSHHLIILRDAGFLVSERRGKWNYYRAHPSVLSGINRELIASLAKAMNGDGTVRKDAEMLSRIQRRSCAC